MRLPGVSLVGCLLMVTCLGPAAAQEGSDLLRRAEMKSGVCCVVGAGDGAMALSLARDSNMLVHVRDADGGAIRKLRDEADRAGFSIQRLLAEQGEMVRLPHADNTLDLIVSNQQETIRLLPVVEVLRALRPDGVAIFGGRGLGKSL